MDGLDDRKNRAVIREALRDAMHTLVEKGEDAGSATLVFYLLEDAMRTLKRLPDRKYKLRTSWVPTADDWANRTEGGEVLLSAEELEQLYLARLPASPLDIERMHVIFDLYPKMIVGRSKRRDYRVLCFMAMGYKVKVIAKELHLSRQAVYDLKNLQCGVIARRFVDLLPKPNEVKDALAKRELKSQRVAA